MVGMTKARESLGTQRRFSILERDAFTCLFCGARPGNDRLHVDHFYPHSRGGSDHDNNLGAACDRCNAGKSDRIIVPRSICTTDVDQDGAVIWKRWGTWVLSWNADDIGLAYWPEHCWMSLDRVHEPDWHEHLAWKPWMKEDDEIAAIDAHHAALEAKRGTILLAVSDLLTEPMHPLEDRRASGQRWFDFCDALAFARTLVRPPPRGS
jgi:hypothetical protein